MIRVHLFVGGAIGQGAFEPLFKAIFKREERTMRDQYDAEFFGEFHEAFAETVDAGLTFVAGLFRRARGWAARRERGTAEACAARAVRKS